MFKRTKTRRKRKYYNWPVEIAKGNVNRFYNSTDWRDIREEILFRDKYICQFFAGNFEQYGHKPKHIKIVRANTVHHINPLRKFPNECLERDNLISLSHEAHEIIEGRVDRLTAWNKKHRKEKLTNERW